MGYNKNKIFCVGVTNVSLTVLATSQVSGRNRLLLLFNHFSDISYLYSEVREYIAINYVYFPMTDLKYIFPNL